VKAVFFLLLLLAGVWLWRVLTSRSRQQPSTPQKPPVAMVCCHQCGVHVPASDAVMGHKGPYCNQAHLKQAEG